MMDYLKRRVIIFIIAVFLVGLVGTITGTIDNSKASKADKDFNTMTRYDFKDGMFVKGKVYEVYDEFAYEEYYEESFGIKHSERVTAHYYAVPILTGFDTENFMYIAVEISNADVVAQAEKLMQQTWDYYETGTEPVMWNEFDIVGEVYPLTGEVDKYFYEWYSYGDPSITRADYEQHVCPWVIKYHSDSVHNPAVTISIGLMIVGGAGVAAMLFIFFKNRIGTGSVPVTSMPYDSTPYRSTTSGNDYDDRPMPPDSGTDYWGSQPSSPSDDDRPLPPDSGASYWGSAPEQDTSDVTGGTMGYAEKPDESAEMSSVSSLYQQTNTVNNNNRNE